MNIILKTMQAQTSSMQAQTKLIHSIKACCSTCFKIIPAEIVERNGKVFMLKECHGKEEVLIENDVEYYKKISAINYCERSFLELTKSRFEGRNREGFIKESPILLLTVTLKCNLDCPICSNTKYPSIVDHQTEIQFPLEAIKKKLEKHKGKIVTIMGGEPTLREDLPEIIRTVKKSGNNCTLCTNGLKLLNRDYCKSLKESGLDYLDLQFDGFSDDIYIKLRGVPLLEQKMMIMKNLKDFKIRTSLVAVIGKGINENQIPMMMKFVEKNKDFLSDVYLLELFTGNLGDENRLTYSDILKIIESSLGIPRELYIQTKRLYVNFSKLTKKIFGNHFRVKAATFAYPTTIYLKRTEKGLGPYFNIEWLNKTNDTIEEALGENKISCIMHLIKNIPQFCSDKNFVRAISYAVINGFNIFKTGMAMNFPDLMKIAFGSVHSVLNVDLERSNFHEELLDSPRITNAQSPG
jgi:uncharacterized radical SAM superfamily Fe-S cluster-containing enzyme